MKCPDCNGSEMILATMETILKEYDIGENDKVVKDSCVKTNLGIDERYIECLGCGNRYDYTEEPDGKIVLGGEHQW